MATRRQWRTWYTQCGGWLPFDRVRFGLCGVIAGGLMLLVSEPTPLTVSLGGSLVAIGLGTVVHGAGEVRAARRDSRRVPDAHSRPRGCR